MEGDGVWVRTELFQDLVLTHSGSGRRSAVGRFGQDESCEARRTTALRCRRERPTSDMEVRLVPARDGTAPRFPGRPADTAPASDGPASDGRFELGRERVPSQQGDQGHVDRHERVRLAGHDALTADCCVGCLDCGDIGVPETRCPGKERRGRLDDRVPRPRPRRWRSFLGEHCQVQGARIFSVEDAALLLYLAMLRLRPNATFVDAATGTQSSSRPRRSLPGHRTSGTPMSPQSRRPTPRSGISAS